VRAVEVLNMKNKKTTENGRGQTWRTCPGLQDIFNLAEGWKIQKCVLHKINRLRGDTR
jgi:hypothetical protein